MLYIKNATTLQSHINKSKEEKINFKEHYEFWQSCLVQVTMCVSLDHVIAANGNQFLILIQLHHLLSTQPSFTVSAQSLSFQADNTFLTCLMQNCDGIILQQRLIPKHVFFLFNVITTEIHLHICIICFYT